mmetsp:Transcript_22357/g.19264  ORF Transcript_22357/g.19264 Transcript_22357/m.19264 type:complete len:81 (-) Transcript_22357:194-436(-)
MINLYDGCFHFHDDYDVSIDIVVATIVNDGGDDGSNDLHFCHNSHIHHYSLHHRSYPQHQESHMNGLRSLPPLLHGHTHH